MIDARITGYGVLAEMSGEFQAVRGVIARLVAAVENDPAGVEAAIRRGLSKISYLILFSTIVRAEVARHIVSSSGPP